MPSAPPPPPPQKQQSHHKKHINSLNISLLQPYTKAHAFPLCFQVARSVIVWALGSAIAPELLVYKFPAGYPWAINHWLGSFPLFNCFSPLLTYRKSEEFSININKLSYYWNKLLLDPDFQVKSITENAKMLKQSRSTTMTADGA